VRLISACVNTLFSRSFPNYSETAKGDLAERESLCSRDLIALEDQRQAWRNVYPDAVAVARKREFARRSGAGLELALR